MTVHVIATGGTIASHFDGVDWTAVGGEQLVREAGEHGCPVVVEDIATGPSSNLTVDDMVRIAARADELLADSGVEGVVITHGTDTIELSAFVTSLMLGTDSPHRPVVFTGSMRVHSHAAADGPRNIRDAIAVASEPGAIGRGVVVCLEGVLHSAAAAVKVNANSVDAFSSAPFAPVGTIEHGRPVFRPDTTTSRPPATALAPEVPLLTCYPGIDAAEFTSLAAGRRGIVVDAFGDLNLPQQLWGPIHEASNAGVLVVIASRPFTATTNNDGLSLLGAVGAGGLTAQKARLATMAALGTFGARDDATDFLRLCALAYDPLDRSTS